MPRDIKLSTNRPPFASEPKQPIKEFRNYMDGIQQQRENTRNSEAYKRALKQNIGWMNNLDAQDGNADGWVKASILKDNLKNMLSRGYSKEINGELYFSAKETAEGITDEYFGLGSSFYA